MAGERPQRVTVYRSNVKKDVIKIFSYPRIFSYSFDVVVIDARSEPEAGQGKEVLLDVMTCFWQECFTALTNGSNEKIPYIRHDLQKSEWKYRTSPCLWVPKDEVFSSSTFQSICCIVFVWGEEYNSSVSPEFISGIYRGRGQGGVGYLAKR